MISGDVLDSPVRLSLYFVYLYLRVQSVSSADFYSPTVVVLGDYLYMQGGEIVLYDNGEPSSGKLGGRTYNHESTTSLYAMRKLTSPPLQWKARCRYPSQAHGPMRWSKSRTSLHHATPER